MLNRNPRNKVIKLLQLVETNDQREKNDITKIISLIQKHENIFFRECFEAHLTGSALVLNPTTQQVLLHNHKKLNRWLQFGGHADGETNLSVVALKEAQEESGLTDLEFFKPQFHDGEILPIDIEVQVIPKKEATPEHLHLDLRYILTTNALKVPQPEEHESQDLAFFSFAEIAKIEKKVDQALLRLIAKAESFLNDSK